MKIFVIGAGSVGTYLAARLSRTTDVLLVSRTQPVEGPCRTVRFTGLIEDKFTVEYRAWSEIQAFPCDSLILVTAKAYQLKDVLPEILSRLPPGALENATGAPSLVLCQNGLGILDEAQGVFSNLGSAPPSEQLLCHLIRGVCWFGVKLEAPGTLRIAGTSGMDLAGGSKEPVEVLQQALNRSDVRARVFDNVSQLEWHKALLNITINGLCALAQAPNGAAAENPLLRPLAERILQEAAQVARREGVIVTSQDFEMVFRSARATAANHNSTLQDLRSRRPTEIPWLNAVISRKAAKHGLEAPLNDMISGLVGYLEAGANA